jgi:alkanesulfonate monooxygenase SsuD/methylene tetrahydromethanopterin reductase-like flavin-dependent oxidoreductase (luciferase family)
MAARARPQRSAAQRLDDIIAYGIIADRLGLDAYGIGEHHSHAFAVSSPAVALAAVAHATERIRLASAALMVGSPEQVTEKILDLHKILGADRFFGQVDFGGLPRERVQSSIELFGTEVAPAVRRKAA